ncbi:MAG: PIN domain-containing protein [Bacteroidetes bacterium]|nr:PIN domain-containing protein [Bacteroidota bacterium]
MAKKQVICDTDVMIEYWDITSSRHKTTKFVLENEIEIDNIIISAITKMELLMGARNKSEESKIKKKLLRFNTSLINSEITLDALALFERYRLSHGLAIPDCIIASTARITQLELFTYNLKDYKFIESLNLYRSNK